jgi:hypothetical protein
VFDSQHWDIFLGICDIVKYESSSAVIRKRGVAVSCITVVHKLKIIAVSLALCCTRCVPGSG